MATNYYQDIANSQIKIGNTPSIDVPDGSKVMDHYLNIANQLERNDDYRQAKEMASIEAFNKKEEQIAKQNEKINTLAIVSTYNKGLEQLQSLDLSNPENRKVYKEKYKELLTQRNELLKTSGNPDIALKAISTTQSELKSNYISKVTNDTLIKYAVEFTKLHSTLGPSEAWDKMYQQYQQDINTATDPEEKIGLMSAFVKLKQSTADDEVNEKVKSNKEYLSSVNKEVLSSLDYLKQQGIKFNSIYTDPIEFKKHEQILHDYAVKHNLTPDAEKTLLSYLHFQALHKESTKDKQIKLYKLVNDSTNINGVNITNQDPTTTSILTKNDKEPSVSMIPGEDKIVTDNYGHSIAKQIGTNTYIKKVTPILDYINKDLKNNNSFKYTKNYRIKLPDDVYSKVVTTINEYAPLIGENRLKQYEEKGLIKKDGKQYNKYTGKWETTYKINQVLTKENILDLENVLQVKDTKDPLDFTTKFNKGTSIVTLKLKNPKEFKQVFSTGSDEEKQLVSVNFLRNYSNNIWKYNDKIKYSLTPERMYKTLPKSLQTYLDTHKDIKKEYLTHFNKLSQAVKTAKVLRSLKFTKSDNINYDKNTGSVYITNTQIDTITKSIPKFITKYISFVNRGAFDKHDLKLFNSKYNKILNSGDDEQISKLNDIVRKHLHLVNKGIVFNNSNIQALFKDIKNIKLKDTE